jgi:hypothetical protein
MVTGGDLKKGARSLVMLTVLARTLLSLLAATFACCGFLFPEVGSAEWFGNKDGWPAPQDVSDGAGHYLPAARRLALAAAEACARACSPAAPRPAASPATQATSRPAALPSPARETGLARDRRVEQVFADCRQKYHGDERPLAIVDERRLDEYWRVARTYPPDNFATVWVIVARRPKR